MNKSNYSILDAIVLILGIAIGFWLVRVEALTEGGRHAPADVYWVFSVPSFFVIGFIVVGPVLVGARKLQDRRKRMELGELLWLVLGVTYGSLLLAAYLPPYGMSIVTKFRFVYLAAVPTLSLLFSLVIIVYQVRSQERRGWQNNFGIFLGLALAYLILLSGAFG